MGGVSCSYDNITNPSALEPGDAIAVEGSSSTSSAVGSSTGICSYQHHGIYIGGRNQEVIDYVDTSEVRRIHLTVFTEEDERPLSLVKYTDAPSAYEPSRIVERAVTQFRNQNFGNFDILTKNCEHFATYCMFGKSFSVQVDKACVIM